MNEQKRKLSAAQAVMIRERAARGEPHRGLAEEFGLSQAQVSNIVNGRSYQDAGGPITRARFSTRDGLDPMFWYACQGRSWEEARQALHCLQRRKARA